MNRNKEAIQSYYEKQRNFTGGNYNELYIRYQNDYYLNFNINKIKNRKNEYFFPKKTKNSLSTNKLKVNAFGYKAYKEMQDNQYLGNRLRQIFSRRQQGLNTDFTDSKKVKLHSFNRLREIEKKRIDQENQFYRTRINNSSGHFQKSLYKQFGDEQKKYSHNLRKMFPVSSTETKESMSRKKKSKIEIDCDSSRQHHQSKKSILTSQQHNQPETQIKKEEEKTPETPKNEDNNEINDNENKPEENEEKKEVEVEEEGKDDEL